MTNDKPSPSETPPRIPCNECDGRGWHIGDCHPREECSGCAGTGDLLSDASLASTVKAFETCKPKYEQNAVEKREMAREILRLRAVQRMGQESPQLCDACGQEVDRETRAAAENASPGCHRTLGCARERDHGGSCDPRTEQEKSGAAGGVDAGVVQNDPVAPSQTSKEDPDARRNLAGRPTEGRENGGPGNPRAAGSSPASRVDSTSSTSAINEVIRQRPEFIIPCVLFCPHCKKQHIDEGIWATRPHRTHQCVTDAAGEGCGSPFTPSAHRTVGVWYKDLKFTALEEPKEPKQ